VPRKINTLNLADESFTREVSGIAAGQQIANLVAKAGRHDSPLDEEIVGAIG